MTPLRVATYNIHRCVGTDGVESPERIAAVLQELDADVVALQEVACPRETGRSVPELLAAACGARLIEGFTLTDRSSHYGNALLTRCEALRVRRADISVPGREPRGVVEAALDVRGRAVAVFATHFGLSPGERRFQTGRILSLLEATAAEVVMLLGDFNEWFLWGQPLRWLKKRFVTARAPATFPARFPVLRLDRIWVSPPDRLRSLRAHASALSRKASDHLPLVAEIDI